MFSSPVCSAFTLSLLAAVAQVTNAGFADLTFNLANQQLSPDGYTRQVSVANGGFPGPTVLATKGDVIRNTINNSLTDPTMRRSTSIHWHGLFQRTTAYEDGPAFVTQCPISPASTYQYVIPTLDQAGTHWYHSHLGSQYVDGIRGIIVVYDPDDPHKALYDVDDLSTIIQLSDWYHKTSTELMAEYKRSGAEPVPDSGLINGRGRYKNGPAAPWSVVKVTKGKRYRFRVLNNSAHGYYTFQIDGHPLKIIEADGVSHQPMTVNSLDIHPGERYSIIVEANQTASNYWIRAPITAKGSNSNLDKDLVKAILRYDGAAATDPTTSQKSGTPLNPLSLKPLVNPGAPGGSGPADMVVDLKFGGVSGGAKAAWQVNDIQYESPSMPTLLKILSNNATTDADFTKVEHTIVLPYNKIIEVIIHGSSGGFLHPWHLHGHVFSIIQNGGAPNYVDPPQRDVMPVGGNTAVIRFKTDNPGPWFLHCHIDWHLEAGLAVVFAESPAEQREGQRRIEPSPGWNQLCPKYNALPDDQK